MARNSGAALVAVMGWLLSSAHVAAAQAHAPGRPLAPRWPESIATASAWTGIHIPRDLREALDSLPGRFPQLVPRFRAEPEDSIWKYHHTVGLWIRNEWGLWAGSRLARYFRRLGVAHPDDMSSIILTSLWREVNRQPVHLRALIACLRRYQAIVDSAQAAAGDTASYYLPVVICGPSGPVEIRRGAQVMPGTIIIPPPRRPGRP